MTHVLVTGGAGYIGSVLTELLLEKGYEVTVLDRLFFGDTLADLRSNSKLSIIKDDIRWCPESVFKGIDAVFDLAALSNDPAGELNPEKTLDINFRGRKRIAGLAKKHGVKRYVLASSCSIYGFQKGIVDEDSPVNPLTTYAKANQMAEQAALALADENFTVTCLRQATVYGLSRRMRFDLAINGMTLSLFKNGAVNILRDGTQWRPMIHVKDTSSAFIKVLEASSDKIKKQIFNVGSDNQNLQILPLARQVSEAVNIPFKEEWYGDPDNRSYQVSFKKIKEILNYTTQHTPETGAKEIYESLKSGKTQDTLKTKTLDWYKHLLEWHSIVKEAELNDTIL